MDTTGLEAISDVLMATPLACFTCGTRMPSKKMMRYLFDVYTTRADPGVVLTELSFVRPCCRRTVMTVPISEQAIQALQALSPDEPAFKALVATVFARPDATPAPAPAPTERRVASRGRKAEPIVTPAAPRGAFELPTTYPYNVYVTPKKGTSELVKGFRVYAPEDLEQVKTYETERNLKYMGGQPSIVAYKEYHNPTEAQLVADEAIAQTIAQLTSTAKELQYYAKKSKQSNTQRYQELQQEYTETKRALDAARRRYGTPAAPAPDPGAPVEDARV